MTPGNPPRPWERPALLVGATFALAVALRFLGLGDESFWLDEGYSVFYSEGGPFDVLRRTYFHETNPPLYYVLLSIWRDLFGDSDVAIRSLSAVIGSGLVLLTYLCARQFFDETTGVLATLLVGLSAFQIEYSQEARAYALLAVLSTASMYYFGRLWSDTSLKTKVLYVICSGLLLYTHVFGVFILMAQNVYWLTMLRDPLGSRWRTAWLLLQAATLVMFLPWMPSLIKTSLTVQGGFWIHSPSFHDLTLTVFKYGGSMIGGLLCLGTLLFAPFATVVLTGATKRGEALSIYLKVPHARGTYLLLLWLVTPILVPFLVSKVSQPIYLNRYTIGASVAFYILVARGLIHLASHAWTRTLAALCVVVAFAFALVPYYRDATKEDWRTAIATIEAQSADGDMVLVNSIGAAKSVYRHYRRRMDLPVRPVTLTDFEFADTLHAQDLDNISRLHSRVWLVLSHSEEGEALKSWLGKYYVPAASVTYRGINVAKFERK